MRLAIYSGATLAVLGVSMLLAQGSRFVTAQYPDDEDQIAAGSILVANEKLPDPNFAKTVILLVDFDPEKGAMGLVINRQTEVTLSTVFPKAEHVTKDPVYLGGPVETDTAQALLRLTAKEADTNHVTGDVYVTGSRHTIEKAIASKVDGSKFRLYLGYAGWAAGQLEGEIRIGAWTVMHGSSRIVFDAEPETLWSRLTREAHMRLALLLDGQITAGRA